MDNINNIKANHLLSVSLHICPSKTAVLFAGNSYSYQMLENKANSLAKHFQESNLAGERIAFMLPNGIEIITLYLACFKAGCIAMPINRRYAPPELARVIKDAEPKYLIMEVEKLSLLESLDLSSSSIQKILAVGQQNNSFNYPDFNALFHADTNFITPAHPPEQPALIFYTSGSTGQPKGVIHSHRSIVGILNSTSAALENITEADKMIIAEPQCHVSGFMETFSTLCRGATVILHDGFNLDNYLKSLYEDRPTLAVPHIDTLMKLLDSGRCNKDTFSSFRGIYTGGDELPAALQKRFIECAGKPIQLGYGMTEAIWLSVCREVNLERSGCIGKPIAGAQLRIVDQAGNNVNVGDSGEIIVKGDMVTPGYWRNPVANQELFIDGWLKTGDCAKQDHLGQYWFTGRIKNIIIRNTSNIMPGEIEAAIYQHPAVAAAGVIGIADAKEGQVPVAFVVVKSDAQLNEDELKHFLISKIALYKMPTRIYFIDHMPLTVSGKIDHKKLNDYLPKI